MYLSDEYYITPLDLTTSCRGSCSYAVLVIVAMHTANTRLIAYILQSEHIHVPYMTDQTPRL